MAVVVQDTFTEASDTSLASHTPDIDTVGGGWRHDTSSFTVQASTETVVSDTIGTTLATIDAGVANCIVSGDVTIPVNPEIPANGFALRLSDASTYWLARLNNTNSYQLLRFSGGATLVASQSIGIDEGVTYDFVVTLDGSTISATVDGSPMPDYTSATLNQTETRHGLRSIGGAIYDNFVIDDGIVGGGSSLPAIVASYRRRRSG